VFSSEAYGRMRVPRSLQTFGLLGDFRLISCISQYFFRISRDQDGKVFFYTKTSDDTEPTDYSNKMPDLGVAKLLEGFNDTFLKYYF
jgi:hypothetical protein